MEWRDLPAHADLIDGLVREVETGDEWRWLELSCSLADGRGDDWSDIDVGVGHHLPTDDLRARGLALVESLGTTRGVLVHTQESWPAGILRFAVEYGSGVQLDLVLMPADQRPGLPEQSVSLVDKDGTLADTWTPPVAAASGDDLREWTMLGWWALSNVAKYVARCSLFEAVEALREARTQTLRVFAASRGIAYPTFGLTSLLDFEPFEVPEQLLATYATPDRPADIIDAAHTIAALLETTARQAGTAFGIDLATPWANIARTRLHAADNRSND